MRRLLIALAIALLPASAAAQSLTVADVIELSKAGLGEEALLALIEVNQPIFPVDVDTLKRLKAVGVSPAVITAMIRSGRTPPAAPVEPVPRPDAEEIGTAIAPPVVVIEHHERPVVQEVPVPVPVYVAVPTRRVHGGSPHHPSAPPVVRKPVEPVYWGWGGKLRPDAWNPAAELQKDAKIEIQRK